MKAGKTAVFVTCVAVMVAAPAGAASFRHVAVIDLGPDFNSTTGYGANPIGVAFDGTNAYISGWNNTGAPANIGVVKLENVTGGAPSRVPLSATQVLAPASRGIQSIAYEPTTDSLVYGMDAGGSPYTPQDSFITRRRASDGSLGMAANGSADWTRNGPGNPSAIRPFVVSIDPVGDNTDAQNPKPGVAWLNQSVGRRMMLKLSDGTDFWTASGGAAPGGIVVAGTIGNIWRAMAFDPAGNIALSEDSGVVYGKRESVNLWTTQVAATKNAALNNVGQGIVIMHGLDAGLLAFNARFGGSEPYTLADSTNAVTTVSNKEVHIRNLDGTTTGLSVTSLKGNEDGLGTPWSADTRELAYGIDPAGRKFLLVLDFVTRRLDLYRVFPAEVCDNNLDDDENGLTDCEDPQCGSIPRCQCNNPVFDADGDADVDQEDFGRFQACFTGVGGTLAEGCKCFDRPEAGAPEGDADIDLDDYGKFQACVSGPTIAAAKNCDDSQP